VVDGVRLSSLAHSFDSPPAFLSPVPHLTIASNNVCGGIS
jgi:hypothetical protein